jgi:streptogramin lyase
VLKRADAQAGEGLVCTDYRPPGNAGPTWNIEVASDASVWVSAYRGLARFDLRTGGWTAYTEEDGLPSDQVRAITIEPDGPVWVSFQEQSGAARYDGEGWTHYSTEDGLISDQVAEVSIAPDGSVWFATDGGATHWDRETDTWTDYTKADGLHSNDVWRVLFTPDGRTWFAHRDALTSFLPAQAEDGTDEWEVHDGFRFLAASEALVSEDGRLWLGQVFWDPEEGTWLDTVYRELEVLDLAVDGRGGLWIARPDGAIYLPDPEASPPEEWRHYGGAEGLADDRVLVITLEGQAGGPEDVVWFGLVPGVARCVVGWPQEPVGAPTALP